MIATLIGLVAVVIGAGWCWAMGFRQGHKTRNQEGAMSDEVESVGVGIDWEGRAVVLLAGLHELGLDVDTARRFAAHVLACADRIEQENQP